MKRQNQFHRDPSPRFPRFFIFSLPSSSLSYFVLHDSFSQTHPEDLKGDSFPNFPIFSSFLQAWFCIDFLLTLYSHPLQIFIIVESLNLPSLLMYEQHMNWILQDYFLFLIDQIYGLVLDSLRGFWNEFIPLVKKHAYIINLFFPL